jgi:adhesin transport system outer membrane protein
LINGRERLDLLADAANISKTVMEDRKKLRDAGKETALSVLDAEVEYYGVLANKINAMFDTRIGSYRLLATMGKLTPALIGLDGGKFRLPVKPLQQELDSL